MNRFIILSICIYFSINSNAQQWHPLAGGIISNGNVVTIEADTFRNKIYIAGQFSHVDTLINVNGYAQWDGVGWSRIGTGATEVDPLMRHILRIIKDTLFLGGYFYWPNVYMAVWPMAGSWTYHSLSSDFIGSTHFSPVGGGIDDFILYNNELYASGTFTHANVNTPDYLQVNNIAKWNGNFWE